MKTWTWIVGGGRLGVVVGLLLASGVSVAQQPIRNPSAVAFLCPDHAQDTEHEIDIVRVSDAQVVATLLGGDPPLNAQNEVVVPINVQPIAFGQYQFVARAVAGTVKSANSVPSDIWERTPGAPSKPEAR